MATSISPPMKQLTTMSEAQPETGAAPNAARISVTPPSTMPTSPAKMPTSDAMRIGAAEQPVTMSTASLTRLRNVQLDCPPIRAPRSYSTNAWAKPRL